MSRDVSIDWPELREIDGTPQIDNLEHLWVRSQRKNIRPSTSTLDWEQLQEWWYRSAVAFKDERYYESQYLLTQIREAILFWRKFPTVGDWEHQCAVDAAEIFNVEHRCDYRCNRPKPAGGSGSMIERIKAALPIEVVAARLTDLRPTGDRFIGKCPLHAEQKGESFTVWPEQGKFKCWGACGVYGDVIDLINECKARGLRWNEHESA